MPYRTIPCPDLGGEGGNSYMYQDPNCIRRMRIITTTAVTVDLSHTQKHIMRLNGTFDFSDQNSSMCFCGHSTAEHLDNTDCCLFAEDEELCLCNKFLDKNFRISGQSLTRRGTVRKDKKAQTQSSVLEPEVPDKRLDSYIKNLAQI
jgi:hypothetical protein